ncbi:uncharacterized protein [Rutidosis leptorrhynchoides]|uniref:uncharacterized protein isoform X3 n=1 Tax=Rutidosis leptorrhynchoides TaxID=125765 RepID=UPI003A993F12
MMAEEQVISVWWDIDSCEIPEDCRTSLIRSNIQSALVKEGYIGAIEFFAVEVKDDLITSRISPNYNHKAHFCQTTQISTVFHLSNRNRKHKSRNSERKRVKDDMMAKETVSVWWDMESCKIPEGCDTSLIRSNIESALLNERYSGTEFFAFGYRKTLTEIDDEVQGLKTTGFSLDYIPEDEEGTIKDYMYNKMLLWAIDNKKENTSHTILLISAE